MPGGLLQIASSGIQDHYLTKSPEITFFKKIYRRITNFSKELIEVSIENFPDFGENFFINIPKHGDLVHRIFFKIELPKLNIDDSYIKNQDYINLKNNRLKNILDDRNLWKTEFDKLKTYSDIQIDYYVTLQILLQSQDVSFDTIQSKTLIQKNMWSSSLDNIIFKIDEDIKDKIDLISYVLNLNLSFSTEDSSTNNTITYATFKSNIEKLYNNNISQLNYYYSNYVYNKKLYTELSNGNIKYSWVKNLGHHYFSSYEAELNGEQIERYSNDYFNIYQNHNLEISRVENYNQLIGNVPSVNEFSSTKENFVMFIPGIFWFNRNSSQSLPLVAMKHSQAQINLTINNLENLIYFEDFNYEFNQITIYKLPFKDHTNNGNVLEALYTFNSDVSNIDISNVTYMQNERIYVYHFKYITKELLRLKFPNLTTSQINSLFTNYSTDGVTLDLEDWIKFRINTNEYSNELIELSKEINYNNHFQFIDTNYLKNKVGRPKISLFLEYIFLDEVERFKFAKSTLEYVVNFPFETITDIVNEENFTSNLNLLKPTKDLFWLIRPKILKNGFTKFSNKDPNLYNQYYFKNDKLIDNLRLIIQDDIAIDFKFGENLYLYSNKYQRLNRTGKKDDGYYYYYSFCLYPENDQPSGSANFSVIKSKNMEIKFNKTFLSNYFNNKINLSQQNIEFLIINNYYSLLSFSKGKANKIIY